MSKPQVTIAVSPREHFSFTQINLESIYAQTRTPFKLIYVDGGSPRHIAEYLETQATEKDFRLIRVEHYLSGNQARNLGLREVDTEYVAFVDNDVVVTPGWLESLVQCAEETSAWLVGPVYCIGKIEDQIIHIAGGDAHIEEDPTGIRRLIETQPYCDQRLEDVRPHLRREPCELVEFHCMLARSEVFKRIGPLDEALMGTRDNIDICLSVRQAGGTVYYEPKVVVNQLFPPPFAPWDVPYFLLRWSDEWTQPSLHHFNKKWCLNDPDYNQSLRDEWLLPRRRMALAAFRDPARRILGWRMGTWVSDQVDNYLIGRAFKKWRKAVPQPQPGFSI